MMSHRALIVFLSFVISFAACNDRNDKDYTTRNVAGGQADTAIDIYAEIDAWQGNIDGKYPVLMWYRLYDGVLSGYLFYTDNKIHDSLHVIGTYTDTSARILEMMPNGNVTGIWDLDVHISSAEGLWFSPKTRNQWSASLMHIDTAVVIPMLYSVGDISGDYRYKYTDEGSHGYMRVDAAKGKVSVQFQNVTGEPARNMATLGPFDATLKGNAVTYSSKEYGDCEVRIRFFNGFAIVNYTDDKGECGFGHNATIDGIYLKEK